MNMIVTFCNSESNKVAERYFNSEFKGHARTGDRLTHFKNEMALFNPSSLVQIFMDDPNVILKFYHYLFQQRKDEELPDLLVIGSCSLHVVHGSFKKRAKDSGWNLGNTLHSLRQFVCFFYF